MTNGDFRTPVYTKISHNLDKYSLVDLRTIIYDFELELYKLRKINAELKERVSNYQWEEAAKNGWLQDGR